MPDTSVDLPEVEPRDPEPVAVAIETARALFRSGERLDALRWLRRAAERAEEAGDDVRSVSLARSAADLSTELQSVLPPPMTSAPPPPASPPPTSRRHDEAIALAAYDDFSDNTVVDAAVPALPREALQSGVQITELPESQQSPHSATMPSPSSSIPSVENTPDAPITAVTPTTPMAVAKPALRQALRVALRPDPAYPGGWLVRPLAEGKPVPADTEEALLVALNPHSHLLD
ncbi:MAG: hypothetical protein ABI548_18105 [Polyangiaceae bacterium]